jgi:glycosyltransferase involved in cell wall biosynthesis
VGSGRQSRVNGIAFLTWSSHRRTSGLAAALGIELLEVTSARRGLARHIELAARTVRLLCTRSFRVIVAQNPSIVLATLLACIRPARRYRLVIDAHNEAITPFVHDVAVVRALSRWLLRRARLTIVTNAELAERVRQARGQPFVLPDPLPAVPPGLPPGASRPPYVVVVCTFAPDEPLEEIFAAARTLAEVRFKVTGNARRCAPALLASKPANVELTGFLDERSYWTLLAASQAVLDLTSMPDCLVCGAYEALALGVPMILTDNPAGRRLFGQTALFTGTTPAAIAAAIEAALVRPRDEAAAAQYATQWRTQISSLRSALLELAGSSLRDTQANTESRGD